MNFYTVRKNTYYLDRLGYDAFEPVPMTEIEADRVAATDCRAVVQVWRVKLERAYPVSAPVLPQLELVG